MSEYNDAFSEAKNRFRQTGVGGKLIESAKDSSHVQKTDVKKMVFMDKQGNIKVGDRKKDEKIKLINPNYGIIGNGLKEHGEYLVKPNDGYYVSVVKPIEEKEEDIKTPEDIAEEERMNGRGPKQPRTKDYGSDID